MKAVKVQDVQPDNRTDVIMKTIFGAGENGQVTMGIAVFPPGARVPAQNAAAHACDEYSYIIKGSIRIMSGGQEQRLSAQQASFIPAGEEHWAYNDSESDCELIWSLIEK